LVSFDILFSILLRVVL